MPGWPRSIIYKNYVAVVVEEKCQATPLPLKKKKKAEEFREYFYSAYMWD